MFQHDSHCFAQYFYIKSQAPVRNITAIKCYHLFKIRNLTAPTYLPHPGDPRFDCQAASMVQLIFHPLIFCRWSCTYQRHIPFEYIPELWKLIDGPVADLISNPLFYRSVRQTPAADDARVKIQFKHHSVRYTVFCGKCCFVLLRIQIHTAEFIARKFLAILSDPGLSEEDRTGRFMIDHRCKDQKQNSCEDASDDASENIHQPFEKQFPGTYGTDACGQHRVSSEIFHKLFVCRQLHPVGKFQMYRYSHFRQLVDPSVYPRIIWLQIDKYFIHPCMAQVIHNRFSLCHKWDVPQFFGKCFLFIDIDHSDSTDLKQFIAVMLDIFPHLWKIGPVGQYHDRILSSKPQIPQYMPFPENSCPITDYSIKDSGQKQCNTRKITRENCKV